MYIDLTNDKCPITFVKTKIALEKLKIGQKLTVHIKTKEAIKNITSSLSELGYFIEKKDYLGKDTYSILIATIKK